MQQAALAPPWAAHAPKSLPVPRSSLGFACTPISKTPLGQASPQMLQPPAPLGCGSSASGEKARMSKDAQTSPLAQMLHPGIRRVEMPQQVRRRQGCCPGCPSGALAHTGAAGAAISGLHNPELPSTSQQIALCYFFYISLSTTHTERYKTRGIHIIQVIYGKSTTDKPVHNYFFTLVNI